MNKIKKLSLAAVLCAAALIIFVIEAQIPVPVPIPGVKLGLANVITLFALMFLDTKSAFAILVTRILLGSLITGQLSAIPYSLSGGLCCLAIEAICIKFLGKKFICEISIIGAMVHVAAQLVCAALITQTASVFVYLPPLLITSIITGAFCGLCTKYVEKALTKKA